MRNDNADFAASQTYAIQKTFADQCVFEGVSLHHGSFVRMVCKPAAPNTGIVFRRVDLPERPAIAARWDRVVATELATTLGLAQRPEARVSTVEHVMAALYALGITNAEIELNGPEVPILDGSARDFVAGFLEAGLLAQPYTTRRLRIAKMLGVYENGAVVELIPRRELRLTISVDFPHPSIGLQTYALDVTPESFAHEIADSRTFGFLRDLDKLRRLDLARGASLENVLAFSEDGILNPEGMRREDECVRHKMLDALGDLALFGSRLEGEFVSFRGGHAIHARLLRELAGKPELWEEIPAEPLPSARYTEQRAVAQRLL